MIRAGVAATVITALATSALLPSCSLSSSAKSDSSVLVLAAASLTDVFGEIGAAYEAAHPDARIEFSFSGSSAIKLQIEQGAPADVVALADTEIMDSLVADGLVAPATVFASNAVAIAVPSGNPASVTSIDDFERSELLLGTCAVQVPCGAYAGEVFAAAGIDAVLDTTEPDVRTLTAKLARGELDAGLVYRTDIIASDGALEEIPMLGDVNVTATYPIAHLAGATSPAAQQFIDFVLSDAARSILIAAGFGAP